MTLTAVSATPIVASGARASASVQADASPNAPSAAAAPTRVIGATVPQQPLVPPRLYIELDEASDRFVQTVIDATNETVLRRFPDEGRLAFSRGVNAYVRAMRER